jgi:hypothetical protein
MTRMRGGAHAPIRAAWRAAIAAMLTGTFAAIAAAPAQGAEGYELNSSKPSLALGSKFPHGLAVHQASRRLYVAIVTNQPLNGAPGEIARFESNGTLADTFAAGGKAYFTGVAVNQATQAFYGAESVLETPAGKFGTAQMDPFSSTGVFGTPFALSKTGALPQIAIDSNGDVYFPNAATNTVQVFNSAGVLQETISCTGCTGGAFGKPVSVALNSEDDLYVADLEPDRAVKLTLSGGSYTFDSLLQSGRGAAAVGVDPSTDDVLVGDMPGGRDYHVVAYDSSGDQFDDFGAGLFTDPEPFFGALVAPQIAVDATTHSLYIGDANKIYIFNKVTISPPTAVTNPASSVGQLVATMNATVNAKGHAATACSFQYVDDADFQASGFVGAATKQCSKNPDGSSNVAISANLSGLSPSTTYHYRVTVANDAGSVVGGEQVFTTLPVKPPTVDTDPATGVTKTGATMTGRVNPHGGTVTDCHFEYGTTTAYGSSVPCKSSVGPVTTEVSQKLVLTGLSIDTAYHFRLVATTNAGTVQGDDVTFSTLKPPPPPPPPPPPLSDTPPSAPPDLGPLPPIVPPPLTCGKGFVKLKVAGKLSCVRKCRKGFVRKTIRGKVRCVKRKPVRRSSRRQPARAGRR